MAKKKAKKVAKISKSVKKVAKKAAKKAVKKAAPKSASKAGKAAKKAVAKTAPRKAAAAATRKAAKPAVRKSAAQPIPGMATPPPAFNPVSTPERAAKPFDPDLVEQEAGIVRDEPEEIGGFGDDEDDIDEDVGIRRARVKPPSGPLPVGTRAPELNLDDEAGRRHTLAHYRGRRVVLFFYPKDDTPGCTAEACGFRDRLGEFDELDAVVLGVSPDSVASHLKFRQKFGLTFPLLADVDHRAAEQYGVWIEKSMYGRKYMGVARTTFVISPEGRIELVFEKVDPEGHEAAVLAALQR